ncbi:MAG: hypothetical protein NC079_06380 [Clostridium sp.]|nr:hypothetical protein [Acetatifactor muris]MCM1526415.1 hypothetical protein [Bacteroides sp.]MCM1563222.1 hypothetical protein [Clostridium sp.]
MAKGAERNPVKLYGGIAKFNLRHNFIMYFAAAVAVLVLTVLLFNITDLDGRAAAQPIEFMLSWTGVVLLVPVFWPEQDKNLRDVIRSKWADYLTVCLVRVLYSTAALAVLNAAFVGLMGLRESQVTWRHVVCAFATALFLGAAGFAAAGICDNTVAGYMVALMYYLVNYGLKDKLGPFYLFSMYTNGGIREKWWQLAGGAVLIAITFLFRSTIHKSKNML